MHINDTSALYLMNNNHITTHALYAFQMSLSIMIIVDIIPNQQLFTSLPYGPTDIINQFIFCLNCFILTDCLQDSNQSYVIEPSFTVLTDPFLAAYKQRHFVN